VAKNLGCLGGLIIAVLIFASLVHACDVGSSSSGSSTEASYAPEETPGYTTSQVPAAPTIEPTDTPQPTDPPTLSPAEEKAQFLQSVDESISGARIAGNPIKYEGDHVDLHGTVSNVLDDSDFNLETGDMGNGDYAIILITTDPGRASALDAGQAVRVLGTVAEPTSGTNAMGGAMDFATVHADYIE
jgi:hypothetical protein